MYQSIIKIAVQLPTLRNVRVKGQPAADHSFMISAARAPRPVQSFPVFEKVSGCYDRAAAIYMCSITEIVGVQAIDVVHYYKAKPFSDVLQELAVGVPVRLR